MKTLIMIVLSLLFMTGCMYGQNTQPPPVPAEEQPEVQTRGPVNEAFAQPVTIEEDNGYIVPKAPPQDIDETPPAERPVGEQFTWIPGYWAWDSERNEHIWVSGCWRAVPPGKYWVPGYWAKVQGGYRWVPGFWAISSEREIEYLPPPPAVTYVEPQGPERPDMIWVPACYYWSHGRYTLRAGYWIEARPDWVWVPSHYIWTPRGYVFVSGHWDYPLTHRGVLFAPVYFHGNIYGGHRLSYSLSIVLDLGSFEFGLFTRPGYGHYYFGDYYDSFYIGIGIFPWFECVSRHTWYDPIYMHDHWRHRRDDHDWGDHERREYERRRDDRDLRPPRTYHDMERRMTSMPESRRRDYEVAAPMKRIIERNTTSFKYRQTQSDDRKQIIRHKEETYKYRSDRSRKESSEDRSRNDWFERDKTRTQKPAEMQDSKDRKKPDFRPNEQREQRDKDYKRRTDLINSNEGKEIQTPLEQGNPDVKTDERRNRNSPTERKGRDFMPSDRRRSDNKDDQTRMDRGRSFEGSGVEVPVEQEKQIMNTNEIPADQAPVVNNSPDANSSGGDKTYYPRHKRSEEVRERIITPPVQENITEGVQAERQKSNRTRTVRPSPQIIEKYKEELSKDNDSSGNNEEEVEKVRKARPDVGRLRRL